MPGMRSISDLDHGGAERPALPRVSRPHHLGDDVVAPVAGLVHDGLGDRGIEHLTDRVDPHEALLLEGAEQGGHDRLDLGGAVGEGPSHASSTEQALDDAPGGASHLVVDAALGELAEVVEVGRGRW